MRQTARSVSNGRSPGPAQGVFASPSTRPDPRSVGRSGRIHAPTACRLTQRIGGDTSAGRRRRPCRLRPIRAPGCGSRLPPWALAAQHPAMWRRGAKGGLPARPASEDAAEKNCPTRGIARDACRTPVQNGAAMSGRNAPPGMAGERPRKRLRTPPVLQMTCLYQHQVQWIIWLRRRHLQTRKTAVSDCGTYVLRLFNAVLR